MNTLSYILAGVALMAGAVIYGTDVFCAIVQRPALAHVAAATGLPGGSARRRGRAWPVSARRSSASR